MRHRQSTVPSDRSVSVIVPVYNEIENIKTLYNKFLEVSDGWNRDYEIIFVDDGSSDGTEKFLETLPEKNNRIKVIQFTRNFGQAAAVAAGIKAAESEYIVFIDSDLQVDPVDIGRFLEKLDSGYDYVAGYRENRKEPFLRRRIPSLIVNTIFNKLLKLPYKDIGCGLQAYRRKLIQDLNPDSYLYELSGIYVVWRGGAFLNLPVTYRERTGGKTKYNYLKLLTLFLNIMLTFLQHPYQLAVLFSIGIGFVLSGIVMIVGNLFVGFYHNTPPGWGMTGGLAAVVTGIVLVSFGFINERINRISKQINHIPLYCIKKIISYDHIEERGMKHEK